jgi:hypothetical protein
MEINEINEEINSMIHHIHNFDLNSLFNTFDKLLTKEMEEKVKVRTFANVLRIFLLKEESSFNFIKAIVDKINNEYSEYLKYDSLEISITILSLQCSYLEKRETIDKLLEIANRDIDFIDRFQALNYIGTIILSSGNKEQNETYFAELEALKGDENHIIDNLDFDKVTTRFNFDHYEILIKVTEMKIQRALKLENHSEIDSLLNEVIDITDTLIEEERIDDPQRVSLYTLAKMSQNSGYIDLEDYFIKLYNATDIYKGYVLESYYEYLALNYPARLVNDFKEIFTKYWEESYESDDPKSKEAFLYTAIDYLSSFNNAKIDLDKMLEEIKKLNY